MASSGTLPTLSQDRAFGRLLIERGLVSEADLQKALVSLAAGGAEAPRLGELLVDAGLLALDRAGPLLADIAAGVIRCPGCGGGFPATGLRPGARFRCKSCGGAVSVPVARISATVMGRYEPEVAASPGTGSAGRGPESAPAPDAADADEDALLRGDTGGGVLHFDEEEDEEGSRAPSEGDAPGEDGEAAPVPLRRSGRGEPAAKEKLPDPYWWHRFFIFVVFPVGACVAGFWVVPWIKGATRAPAVEEDRWAEPARGPTAPAAGTPAPPITADTRWKDALAIAREADRAFDEARKLKGEGKAGPASDLFQKAEELYRRAIMTAGKLLDPGENPELEAIARPWGDRETEAYKQRQPDRPKDEPPADSGGGG
ncbi:MAG: hypothetical protein L0216_05890 [Planctomycetales bacterium]|nr:hypothetical protein [Planctomycetales bacterium]